MTQAVSLTKGGKASSPFGLLCWLALVVAVIVGMPRVSRSMRAASRHLQQARLARRLKWRYRRQTWWLCLTILACCALGLWLPSFGPAWATFLAPRMVDGSKCRVLDSADCLQAISRLRSENLSYIPLLAGCLLAFGLLLGAYQIVYRRPGRELNDLPALVGIMCMYILAVPPGCALMVSIVCGWR
jgi:hypothetical protein